MELQNRNQRELRHGREIKPFRCFSTGPHASMELVDTVGLIGIGFKSLILFGGSYTHLLGGLFGLAAGAAGTLFGLAAGGIFGLAAGV